MDSPAPSSRFLSRRLFLGGLAAVYVLAFASLGVQVLGLYGARGIVPLASRMASLGAQLEGLARLEFPTLLWLDASDPFLLGLCVAGSLAGLAALLGLAPRLALGACWLLYLSFVSVGSPFLDFQWDGLLLEAGLLAVLDAPGGWRPFGRTERAPSPFVHALEIGLLGKLMFLSGVVKLTSGDPAWRDGTALAYHWWTQPLPHRLSVQAAVAPAALQRASTVAMFVIELGLPCLLLVPFAVRRLRQVVAVGTTALMLAVFLTGNYGFFNLLTALLCLPLLDDRAWETVLRAGRRLLRREPAPERAREPVPTPRARRLVLVGLAAPLALVSLGQLLEGSGLLARAPAPLVALESFLAPLRSVNRYGLFRVMTKERPELRLEGSDDGLTWIPYRFRYKPGDPRRAPVFAGLHMPRLDWQLWFAALEHRGPRRSRWVADLVERLLEGSPEVLGLLGPNPFPDGPPRFVRVMVADCRFARAEERARGLRWHCGESEPFLPARSRAR